MLGHILRRSLEQLRRLRLREPETLILKTALDACCVVLHLIKDPLRSWGGIDGTAQG